MTELEYLSDLVILLRELVFLFRISLICLGCLCGFMSSWMVICFIKHRDIL